MVGDEMRFQQHFVPSLAWGRNESFDVGDVLRNHNIGTILLDINVDGLRYTMTAVRRIEPCKVQHWILPLDVNGSSICHLSCLLSNLSFSSSGRRMSVVINFILSCYVMKDTYIMVTSRLTNV